MGEAVTRCSEPTTIPPVSGRVPPRVMDGRVSALYGPVIHGSAVEGLTFDLVSRGTQVCAMRVRYFYLCVSQKTAKPKSHVTCVGNVWKE